MNEKLKQLLKAMYQSVDAIGKIVHREDLHEAAVMEMAQYMMYLSASDGRIRWTEAKIISDYLELELTPDTIQNFIEENHIYSAQFEKSVPVIFRLLVETDNELIKRGVKMSVYASEWMVAAYKGLGLELIKADADVGGNEYTDILIYVKMLEDYLAANLLAKA